MASEEQNCGFQLKIVKGPSHLEVHEALKYRREGFAVTFRVLGGPFSDEVTLHCRVNGLLVSDRAAQTFKIWLDNHSQRHAVSNNLEGWYNPYLRKGELKDQSEVQEHQD